MVYTPGGIIEAADYNQLASDINTIFGTGTGDSGYCGDSPTVPTLKDLPDVLGNTDIDNQNWLDLRNAIADCADHQGTTLTDGLPSITDIEDGDLAAFFPRLSSPQNLFDITDNRFNVNPLFVPTIVNALPLDVPRTATWGSLIQHEFIITFNDSDHARAFFNAGGTIRISALRSGPALTLKDSSWDSVLPTNSPFIFNRESYFSLTSAFEDLRPPVSPTGFGLYSVYSAFGAYSDSNIWTIIGKRDDAQGPNGGNGSIIRITSSFLDGNSNTPDVVSGTFSSTVEEHKFTDGTGSGHTFDIPSPTYRTIVGVTDGF